MRKYLMIPFAALLLALALNDSSAQPPSKVKDKLPPDRAATGGLEFQIYTDAGGKFRYRLVDGDMNLGMASKGYDTLADVRRIVKQIQDGAAKAKIVEGKADTDSKAKR